MGPPQSSQNATPQRSATSRLLAMKFMNRLGPGDASTPSTPGSADSSRTQIHGSGRSSQKRRRSDADDGDDDNDDENSNDDINSPSSAKRRRVAAAADDATTTTPSTTADMEAAMRASLAEEERRRQAAVAKRAAELGDEHWTWSAPLPPHVAAKLAAHTETAGTAGVVTSRMPYAVVRVGYAEIDSAAAEAATPITAENKSLARLVNAMKPGIMRFNMKEISATEEVASPASENGQPQLSGKAARKAAAAAEKEKEKVRKMEARNLKQLTSLSSQSGQNSMKCHRCGRSGHKAMECPSSGPRRTGSKKR